VSGLVLHTHPWSSNAQKVQLLLDLLGLDCAVREVPFERERPDWHVATNPTGGIPVLIDGDFPLAESNTILRYLADREGRDDLYPRALQARARVDWILDLWGIAVRPALFAYEAAHYGIVPGLGLHAKDPLPEDEVAALFAKAAPRVEQAMAVLDAPGPWACHGRMTIADLAAAPALHRALHAPIDLGLTPRLATWAEATNAIPAWQALVPTCGVPRT